MSNKDLDNFEMLIHKQIKWVHQLEELSAEQLQLSDGKGWNAVECLEHLNLTLDYYLPAIRKSLEEVPDVRLPVVYQPGRIGGWMIRQMTLTAQGGIRMKMKTFAQFTPRLTLEDSEEVFSRFYQNQKVLMELATTARQKDWNKVRVVSAIGPLLRFRLGDCLLFLMRHQERHLHQAMHTSCLDDLL